MLIKCHFLDDGKPKSYETISELKTKTRDKNVNVIMNMQLKYLVALFLYLPSYVSPSNTCRPPSFFFFLEVGLHSAKFFVENAFVAAPKATGFA